MTYTIEWTDTEKTIVLVTFEPGWSWHEFATESSKEKIEMLDAVDHPVYFIQWLKGSVPMPKIGWTGSFQRAGTIDHPNYAKVILVNNTRIAQTMVNVFGGIIPSFRDKMHLVATIDDAFELVQQLKAEAALISPQG